MSQYAADTTVSTENSRAEIERTLRRYQADAFAYGWDGNKAMIQFDAQDRRIRFVLPLPERDDPSFTRTPGRGLTRNAEAAERAWEQGCRQRWRALALCIKAKLEAVESGISTFEEEGDYPFTVEDDKSPGVTFGASSVSADWSVAAGNWAHPGVVRPEDVAQGLTRISTEDVSPSSVVKR